MKGQSAKNYIQCDAINHNKIEVTEPIKFTKIMGNFLMTNGNKLLDEILSKILITNAGLLRLAI